MNCPAGLLVLLTDTIMTSSKLASSAIDSSGAWAVHSHSLPKLIFGYRDLCSAT